MPEENAVNLDELKKRDEIIKQLQERLGQAESNVVAYRREVDILHLIQDFTYCGMKPMKSDNDDVAHYFINWNELPCEQVNWLHRWIAIVNRGQKAMFWLPPLLFKGWLIKAWMKWIVEHQFEIHAVLHRHSLNEDAPEQLQIKTGACLCYFPLNQSPPHIDWPRANFTTNIPKHGSNVLFNLKNVPFQDDCCPTLLLTVIPN